ncbi:hypothetical protein CRV24_009836 [Beauveria bassiana]|nr:hypothetical protein CRV24_009836 [Beauveria bassiana]
MPVSVLTTIGNPIPLLSRSRCSLRPVSLSYHGPLQAPGTSRLLRTSEGSLSAFAWVPRTRISRLSLSCSQVFVCWSRLYVWRRTMSNTKEHKKLPRRHLTCSTGQTSGLNKVGRQQ